MASQSLLNRAIAFFRSPQGQRLVDQGRRQMARPGNRSKLQGLLARFRGRR